MFRTESFRHNRPFSLTFQTLHVLFLPQGPERMGWTHKLPRNYLALGPIGIEWVNCTHWVNCLNLLSSSLRTVGVARWCGLVSHIPKMWLILISMLNNYLPQNKSSASPCRVLRYHNLQEWPLSLLSQHYKVEGESHNKYHYGGLEEKGSLIKRPPVTTWCPGWQLLMRLLLASYHMLFWGGKKKSLVHSVCTCARFASFSPAFLG